MRNAAQIAAELGCHPQTVRIHLKRFTLEGVAGLLMLPRSGRKPRLTQQEQSRILVLVKQAPPGHLQTQADGTMVARDEEGSAQWTLGALVQAAKEAGIKAQTQPDPAHLSARRGAVASHPQLGGRFRSGRASQKNGGRLPLH